MNRTVAASMFCTGFAAGVLFFSKQSRFLPMELAGTFQPLAFVFPKHKQGMND